MTIAALTLLALAALVLEYHTRVLSRALARARGQVSNDAPGATARAGAFDEPAPNTGGERPLSAEWLPWAASSSAGPSRASSDGAGLGASASAEIPSAPVKPARATVQDSGFASPPGRRERLPDPEPHHIGFLSPTVRRIETGRDHRAYMPPGMANTQIPAAPARAPDRRDEPEARPTAIAKRPAPAKAKPNTARDAPPAPVTPEAQVALELMLTVGRLVAIADEMARDPGSAAAGSALRSLRDQAVDYDLDNLMALSNDTQSREAIACFRDALAIANELERLSRRTARMRSSEHSYPQLAVDRAALLGRIAAAVALGTALAQRMEARPAAAARDGERRGGADSPPIPSG